MGLLANFQAKRAARKAKANYEAKLFEWEREHKVLESALVIFTDASIGKQPHDQSLTQKKGELVLWTGSISYLEAGRTPSRFVGGSRGVSIPIGAGIRFRVGSFQGQMVPGEQMQIEKDKGLVKLTNQRLIFSGPIASTEWAFSNLLSSFSNPTRDDYIFGVSNRQKSSGIKFSPQDGYTFGYFFALALHSYEKGLPPTITAIKAELAAGEKDKPVLKLNGVKEIGES
jgi:hypothetical protein